MASKEKVRMIFKDDNGNTVFSFKTKTATASLSKLPKGTNLKVFIDEGFGEQFIGPMVTGGLSEGPVTPPDPNKPPVVNAGEDITVNQGVKVTLDGSATDLDGKIDRVEWIQISQGDQIDLESDAADMTNVSFTAPNVPEGATSLVLEFLIQAFDDKGSKSTDTVKVTVVKDGTIPPPPPPTQAGTLWTSTKWNSDPRTIKGVATDPKDDQLEMRAGQSVDGRKELVIDGKGGAKQTGERYRQYIWNKPGSAGSQGGAE